MKKNGLFTKGDKSLLSWLLISCMMVCAGCNNEKMILGAGSTFDNLLFSKMFYEYHQLNGIKVNYQSIGSGGGIKSLTDEIVDFAATDAVLTEDQMQILHGAVVHIPRTMGAIVMSYNLPGVKDTRQFTPNIIAGIFLGKITRWNDTAIVNANGGMVLPAREIVVIHRSDGSGTTNIFTTYLAKVSPLWAKEVGQGSAVNWPIGLGGKGNEGVAGSIQQTAGSLGYIELAYAIKNKIPYGRVRNAAGYYIVPSATSVSAAANVQLPPDGKASISNTAAPNGYPISGLSWVVLYKEQQYNKRSADRASKMVHLLSWMIHEGQNYSGPLFYAPLSASAVQTGEQILKTITYNNQPILHQ